MQSRTFRKPEEVHWTRAHVGSMPTAVPGNEEGEMRGSWVFWSGLNAADVTFTVLSESKEI